MHPPPEPSLRGNKTVMTNDFKPRETGEKKSGRMPASLARTLRALRWNAAAFFQKTSERFLPRRPSLHAVGDSHAKFMFGHAPGFHLHRLGPVTMHRLARDGREFLRLHDLGIHDRDGVVWCLGEIDVRCHIVRQAQLRTCGTRQVAAELAEGFLRSVAEIQRDAAGLRTIILAVIPPTDQVRNDEYPTVGTLQERVEARMLLNDALRSGCRARGFRFLDPFDAFTDSSGALKESMSDGNVHCGPEFAHLVVDQVRRLFEAETAGS
jgi:hypothetical protein